MPSAFDHRRQIHDQQNHRNHGKYCIHIPVGIRNERPKQRQGRNARFYGIHIVDPNDLPFPVQNVVRKTIGVDSQVAQMYERINAYGNEQRRQDAMPIELDHLKREQEDGNGEFQNMWEIINWLVWLA